MLKLFDVIKFDVVRLLAVILLSTVKLFVISTLLFGTRILPVPLARSSKSALLVVVVTKLSSTRISSNCAAPVISKFSVTVTLPVTPVSPV